MSLDYPGTELALFAGATHWKSYVARHLAPYIGRDVADIGAGIGGNVPFLCRPDTTSWLCVEPDRALAAAIEARIEAGDLPACCRAISATLASIEPEHRFDTILYMDVIEHIEDDRAELALAASRLAPGGHLIVLVPAHRFLYSPFDRSIGHFRRYSRASLAAVEPAGLHRRFLGYLDSVGFFASLANRLALRQAMPTRAQIALWDGKMVPISRRLDPLLGYRFGKSVLAVWTKTA